MRRFVVIVSIRFCFSSLVVPFWCLCSSASAKSTATMRSNARNSTKTAQGFWIYTFGLQRKTIHASERTRRGLHVDEKPLPTAENLVFPRRRTRLLPRQLLLSAYVRLQLELELQSPIRRVSTSNDCTFGRLIAHPQRLAGRFSRNQRREGLHCVCLLDEHAA